MSLITVDLRDRKQLYEQIIDNVKRLVLTGEMKPDDRLPSVRALAKEIGINPNTIQKAYTELERDGVIVTMQGRGSVICAAQNDLRDEHREALVRKMAYLASEMKASGMNEDDFIGCARRGYEMTGKDNEKGGATI